MPKVAEYKIVDYKTETFTVPAEYDDEGNILTEEHTEEKRTPIYAMVYRDMTEAEIAEMPMPSVEEIKAQLVELVQNYMDSIAQTRGYDNVASACSYANDYEPNETFKREGKACVLWRSSVWSYCYQQLDLFEQGKRDIPTDIISELPKLEW